MNRPILRITALIVLAWLLLLIGAWLLHRHRRASNPKEAVASRVVRSSSARQVASC